MFDLDFIDAGAIRQAADTVLNLCSNTAVYALIQGPNI
jgi:hypothetical protein